MFEFEFEWVKQKLVFQAMYSLTFWVYYAYGVEF